MSELILVELFQKPSKIVVTAHRGFSAQCPENTIIAFKEAVKIGGDIVEFDIRGTRERIPVILHDPTIDRTSDGTGSPGDYTLEELKRFDFSFRFSETTEPEKNAGQKVRDRSGGEGHIRVQIPTLVEALDSIPATVGLNIQIKETDTPLLKEVCRLYDSYDLYRRGYLTMSTFENAEKVKSINRRIELCVLERKRKLDDELLKQTKRFGCRFLQPHRRDVTPELCRKIVEMEFCANMFYSNTDEDNRRFISYGIQGILTDAPDILLQTIRNLSTKRG
jgi:glycerophosphoryl diester phosphodiesterase